jgi:hypothetical protein
MGLTPRQKARWERRVDEAVAKMDLDSITGIDPELRDAFARVIAADTLWHLDQMKKPGILYRIFRKKKRTSAE